MYVAMYVMLQQEIAGQVLWMQPNDYNFFNEAIQPNDYNFFNEAIQPNDYNLLALMKPFPSKQVSTSDLIYIQIKNHNHL